MESSFYVTFSTEKCADLSVCCVSYLLLCFKSKIVDSIIYIKISEVRQTEISILWIANEYKVTGKTPVY